jgi:23S rRNA (cytosine1962-C5)-methyltransferase
LLAKYFPQFLRAKRAKGIINIYFMHKIILKKGKEEPVRRFHPWIFSGAIFKMIPATEGGKIEDGDVVQVIDFKGNILAIGYYNDGSIAVRIISFKDVEINQDFWAAKIQNAHDFRTRLGLTHSLSTTCYRLIHAEGDGLPGLIVDIYGPVAVVQCHAIGIHRQLDFIKTALIQVFGNALKAIYDKSYETLPPPYVSQFSIKNSYIFGEMAVPLVVSENDCQFAIDWETGQKTGFFIDQRDNRALLSRYAKGKTVLNAFCYSGGFSVYALKAGAKSVDSVDVSQRAIDLTDKNILLNTVQQNANTKDISTKSADLTVENGENEALSKTEQRSEKEHRSVTADVLQFLKDNDNIYDVMIVDPPAFAKSIAKRHNAVQAYKRLNAMALSQITEGGILFTFSCSQVVDKQLFYDTIVAASIEAGRKVRVMHTMTQPADHPVNIFHPEGSYLKGLVLYVE